MFDLALLAPERRRPLRAEEYMRLVELGAFEGEHIELLAGVIVEMSPQGDDHMMVTAALFRSLAEQRDRSWFIAVHSTMRMTEDSVPEPDLWVARIAGNVRGPTRLVVEVARTSHTKDREIKRHLYAAAGIPEYWLVDLRRRCVEVRTRPTGSDYANLRIVTRADALRPRGLRGVAVPVADFLPAEPTPDQVMPRNRRRAVTAKRSRRSRT